MKDFLKKILIYTFPFLIIAVIAEFLLRSIPSDLNEKAAIINKNVSKIETFILGSSYGLYNLNPSYFNQYTVNSSYALQSLDLDKNIFEKYVSKMKNLKTVIIPISFSSFFFKLNRTENNNFIKDYCIYYNLHISNKLSDYFELLNQPFSVNRNRLIDYYFKNIDNVKITKMGFDSTHTAVSRDSIIGGPTARYAIEELAMKTEYYNSLRESLKKIVQLSKEKNIKVILFTPPAYNNFYTTADTFQLNTSIRTCQSIQRENKNVLYFNYLMDTSFTKDDYYDLSHLNVNGAQKLSEKLNLAIASYSK